MGNVQKKCSACGESQEPGAIFCTNCGQRLAENSNGRKCPSCRANNEQDAAFCIHCGSRLEGPEPYASDTSPMATHLLALNNDFLAVRETAPGRFEFSSETGARSAVQRVKIKYNALAILDPQTKQITFWEKMVESSAGMTAGVFTEKTVQKGIDVGKKIHGQILFGGQYGFEYGKLKDAVKAIAGENGWNYKTAVFKPDTGKDKSSKSFWTSILSMKILIPVLAVFFIAVLGSVAYVYFSGRSPVAGSDKDAATKGYTQPGGENTPRQQIIKTDKDTYDYGERIRVEYFNAPGHSRDWICIVPEGSRNTYAGDYQYIPRRGQGVLTFSSPQPGKYEARAFYRYFPGRYRITARYHFTVSN